MMMRFHMAIIVSLCLVGWLFGGLRFVRGSGATIGVRTLAHLSIWIRQAAKGIGLYIDSQGGDAWCWRYAQNKTNQVQNRTQTGETFSGIVKGKHTPMAQRGGMRWKATFAKIFGCLWKGMQAIGQGAGVIWGGARIFFGSFAGFGYWVRSLVGHQTEFKTAKAKAPGAGINLKKMVLAAGLFLGVSGTMALFPPSYAASKTSETKAMSSRRSNSKTQKAHLTKEFDTLRTHVDQVQRDLDQLAKRMAMAPQGGAKSDLTGIILKYTEKFSQYLKERFQSFLLGVFALGRLLTQAPDLASHAGNWVWVFCLFVALGLLVTLGMRPVVVRQLDRAVRKRRSSPLQRLLWILTCVLWPTPLILMICFVFASILRAAGVMNTASWGTYTRILPLALYWVWALSYAIRRAVAPSRLAQALILLDAPARGVYAANRLRIGVFLYGFCALFLAMSEGFICDRTIVATVLDAAVLISVVLLTKTLQYMRDHVLMGREDALFVRGLDRARVAVVALGGLWLVGKQMVIHVMPVILITGILGVYINILVSMWARCRLGLLWAYRRRGYAFVAWLAKPPRWVRPVLGYLMVALIVRLWVPYVFPDDGVWEWSVSRWVGAWVSSPMATDLFHAFLVGAGAVFVTKGCERLLRYYIEDKYTSDSLENNFLASRLKTLMAVLRTILRVVIWVPAISIIFSLVLAQFSEAVAGITPWISSIGWASVGLTFGIQNVVRDFVTGFFIILENNLVVGDEVDIDGRAGKVETISLRTLKIRADSGMLLTIPFGSISVIGNKNRDFSATVLNVSVGYEANLDQVQQLIEKAFSLVKKTPFFSRRILGAMEFRGITEVTYYSIVVQVKIRTTPNAQDTIRRALTRHLKTLFDEAGIVVPQPPHGVSRASPSLTQTIL